MIRSQAGILSLPTWVATGPGSDCAHLVFMLSHSHRSKEMSSMFFLKAVRFVIATEPVLCTDSTVAFVKDTLFGL